MSMDEKLIEEFNFPKATGAIEKYGYINKDPMAESSCLGRFFFHCA